VLELSDHEVQTLGALGARLYLDRGTLSPMLKRMEATGLLPADAIPADERQVMVALIEQGCALRERAVHVPECGAAS
jgi:DNA-binding MarR family transcriptional regulator